MRLFTRSNPATPAVVAERASARRGGGREPDTNTQEGTSSMTTVSTITACDQWSADAEASQERLDFGVNEMFDGRGATRWCEYHTFANASPLTATMHSDARHIPLRRHPGVLDRAGESIHPAHASVTIRQGVNDVEPHIHIERWAARDQKLQLIDGSWYRFTLDEAEELMNVLALAVAAAREGTPPVGFTFSDAVDLDAPKGGE